MPPPTVTKHRYKYWFSTVVEDNIATMMKIGHHISVLFLLLPLFTLILSASIKSNEYDTYNNIIFNIRPVNVKAGMCPPQRYYIKSEHEVFHKFCKNDGECTGDLKCCLDNGHAMCKPPAKEKAGVCPSFSNAFSSGVRCNDNCTSDSECSGSLKCCQKSCGRSCTPTLNDMGKPSVESTTRTGFCPQEEPSNCAFKEREYCDNASCLDGAICCPKICRMECQKSLPARAGECPTQCPSGGDSKACSTDYDCPTLFKCCATCGNRCVKAVNIPSFLHNSTGTIFMFGGGQ
ncbi:uncharacterized protein ACNLHF_020355 [Anomaloglossus baeobatrachus]|uniref:uncharacterized protein LOC142310058 n=1 Tax=Anomaloglossus baeobatrachus TaxID=238106 RepID=UPI003F507012